MKKLYIIILLCLPAALFAQSETKEVGIRLGYTSGVSFRVNLTEELSYEGQLGYRDKGAIFTVLRQDHMEIGMDQHGNWNFIYGMGAHTGFYFTDSYKIFFHEVYFGREIFTPVIGFDGYVAIEYKMVEAPITFGVSYQPFMEISLKQIFGVNFWDFGFSVKYRF